MAKRSGREKKAVEARHKDFPAKQQFDIGTGRKNAEEDPATISGAKVRGKHHKGDACKSDPKVSH